MHADTDIILVAPDKTIVITNESNPGVMPIPWLFPITRMDGEWMRVDTGEKFTMNPSSVYTHESWHDICEGLVNENHLQA